MIPLFLSGMAFVLSLRQWVISLTEPTGQAGGWWVSGVGADRGVQYFNLLDFDTRENNISDGLGGVVDMEAYVRERYQRDEQERAAFAAQLGHSLHRNADSNTDGDEHDQEAGQSQRSPAPLPAPEQTRTLA